jgi:hypothetical protein
MLGVRSYDIPKRPISLCGCRTFPVFIIQIVSNSSNFSYNSLLFRNRFTQISYYTFIMQFIYVGNYLFATNGTSLGIYVYCYISDLFRLIIPAKLRENVHRKKHLMLKHIVVRLLGDTPKIKWLKCQYLALTNY